MLTFYNNKNVNQVKIEEKVVYFVFLFGLVMTVYKKIT